MSSDLWPPNNPCSPATNLGLSMVSGSQLQVAKLAQMCPAAPSGTQRHPAAHNGAQWVFKTNSPSFYVHLKKMEKKDPDSHSFIRPVPRGPQGALGGLIKIENVKIKSVKFKSCRKMTLGLLLSE